MSLRRIDVSTTSCACLEYGPLGPQYSKPPPPPQYSKPWPRNILNLPTPMSYETLYRYTVELQWLEHLWDHEN